MIRNRGYGTAYQMKIDSGQPSIGASQAWFHLKLAWFPSVDNKKGLPVIFSITGSQVGILPVTPSLSVNLGDIAPNATQVVRWIMECNLSGYFRNLSVTYTHVTGLGSLDISSNLLTVAF
jgi:hypothetical protein